MKPILIRNTPSKVFNLAPNQVFVFGSNTAGIHGAGAARVAREKFGAVMRQGVGLQGSSYAIPSKDDDLCTLKPSVIQKHVDEFIAFAKSRPSTIFLITPIACGLAGLAPVAVAPMFANVPENCLLPGVFSQVLGWPYLHEQHRFTIWQSVGDKILDIQNYEAKDFGTPMDPIAGLELKPENVRGTFTMYGETYQAVEPPVVPVVPVDIPQAPPSVLRAPLATDPTPAAP